MKVCEQCGKKHSIFDWKCEVCAAVLPLYSFGRERRASGGTDSDEAIEKNYQTSVLSVEIL